MLDLHPPICLCLATLLSACLPGSISLGEDTHKDPPGTGSGSGTATTLDTTGPGEPTTDAPAATTGQTTPSTGTSDAEGTSAGVDDTGTSASTGDASASTGDASASTSDASAGDTTSTTGVDTGTDTSSSTGDGTGEWGSCCLIPDAPNAAVSGMTPFGPVDLHWAWYGEGDGQCPDLRFLRILPNPELHPNEQLRHLMLSMDSTQWKDGFQGIGPVWVEVWEKDKGSLGTGTLDVVSYDPAEEPLWCDSGDPVVMTDAKFVATFTVKDAQLGWDLTGEVVATYCPVFNQLCV